MLMSDNAARAVVKSSVGGIFDPENKQIGRVSEPCFTHERRFVAAFFLFCLRTTISMDKHTGSVKTRWVETQPLMFNKCCVEV